MTTTLIPAWQATHVYAAGAVVSQSGKVLPLWRATTAGTSGGSEPAWPAGAPYTVTDGTVTWSLNTTFRQDVHAGILTTLTNFQTANPTLLRKLWHARPDSFTLGDLPAAVIGNLTESVNIVNGIRQRRMDGFTVTIVDQQVIAAEADERMNGLIDALMDYITEAYHMASGTSIVEPIGVNDGEVGVVEATNLAWFSNIISFRSYVMEGRT